jgi:hypothetical protein
VLGGGEGGVIVCKRERGWLDREIGRGYRGAKTEGHRGTE